jgi:hypothetical protein
MTVADPTVSCLITGVLQTGTFTCVAVNGGAMQFSANCPAGGFVPMGMAIPVPAISVWWKFALTIFLVALGVLFVALRTRS